MITPCPVMTLTYLLGSCCATLNAQWLAFGAPDPNVVQYPIMAKAVEHVSQNNGWHLNDVYVWVS